MSETKKTVIRSLLIICSIGMIGFGVFRNETNTVFRKAVNICMECIGLG